MKVLFLAYYFPKPNNPLMGTWALTQAQALVRQGISLQVASFTSWVPSAIANTPGAKAYANCPSLYTWPGDVVAHYPRWLYYPVAPVKQKAYRHPAFFLQLAWQSAKRQLMQLIEQYQPDVFFCHHGLPNGWLLTQLPAAYQRPLIVQEHDFGEIADCRQYPKRQHALQQTAKSAFAWLSVSNRMAQDMRSLFPNANVLVHHNGVNLPPPHLTHQPRPPELIGKKIVLVCAIFAQRKGIPLLIESFRRISSQHPDATLRIVGHGPDEEKIRQTIEALEISDQVQLVGRKSHAEVLQEMAWADCFALTGWDEPFATVYLEAMAAGKPIICCKDGGITDMMKHEVQGLTVPPRDVSSTAQALDRMLNNDEQRQQWGQNAQALIRSSLTWDAKAGELIALFEDSYRNQIKVSAQSHKSIFKAA
ncbi:glycosyltransferase [cf. Phormidesmis sp. LEGE 11477]|uniref:glycosyltransferase n=1 Tax=cf. Phormidesmis sp. LEGE 11477 TaxID=1828680 RepID=UPI00187EE095|nr:glycosyltransferase [cf. Phormidesmis sp. LEGE 11477]MBE9060263.1 glycosyltransferase [cf. Phormidesmis sp. LEGE 11477]